VQVSLAVLLVIVVPAHAPVAAPLAVAEQLWFPPVEQVELQVQGAEPPAARLPMLTVQPQVVLTTTPLTAVVPVLVTVPENTIGEPPTQPSVQSAVIVSPAEKHVQVSLAVLLVTVPPAHAPVLVPVAVAEQETSPVCVHVTGQVHGAEPPTARLPTLTVHPHVVLTTTPLTAVVPVLLTMPENVIVPLQLSLQVVVIASEAV
jgi:hypothetical protein